MSNKMYDVLTWVGKIVLPALAVFYGTLGKTWGLPYVVEIPETIMAIDLFLNTILGISNAEYYKGQVEVVDENVGENG